MDFALEFRVCGEFQNWECLKLIQVNLAKVSKEQHTSILMNYLNLIKYIY